MEYDDRTAFINGLLDLAAFLEAHPNLPVPPYITVYYFPNQDSDAAQSAEIDQIAPVLGSNINQESASRGHYATSRMFGPIEYRAVAVLAAARARHEAESSYHGCIQPDPVPTA